jgi:hypothetical protein
LLVGCLLAGLLLLLLLLLLIALSVCVCVPLLPEDGECEAVSTQVSGEFLGSTRGLWEGEEGFLFSEALYSLKVVKGRAGQGGGSCACVSVCVYVCECVRCEVYVRVV